MGPVEGPVPQNRRRASAVGAGLAGLLALIIGIFFHRLAGGDLILARGDLLLYFYPYWESAAEALRAGRVPLWNPSLFMGAPLMANSQVGLFYPLNWPFWLLLPTPYAVSYSILLHLLIAAIGVYLVAGRCLTLSRTASFLAAVLFALGGYVTAQVEHINQLQGIAWLPWYFVVLCPWKPQRANRLMFARVVFGIATLLSLQLLSGHSQTVFISLAGVAIWSGTTFIVTNRGSGQGESPLPRMKSLVKSAVAYFGPLVIGIILALTLSAVQLLPTWELSRQSLRAGGLPSNEVLSFSLQPLNLGQSILPGYEQSLFSEYVLFLPITALLLAAIGIGWLWKRGGNRQFILVGLLGLLLAFGRYNPLYHLLAQLPGFDLFRAPARWSVLFALAMALMAAAGWQALSTGSAVDRAATRKSGTIWALAVGVIVVLMLIGWSLVSAMLANFVPVAQEAPVGRPNLLTVILWFIELILASTIALVVIRGVGRRQVMTGLLLAGSILVLFLGTRVLPYNNPTTPEAYLDYRSPMTRLLAASDCLEAGEPCYSAGRVLSLSDIFFDVGDQTEIDTIYQDQLDEQARFDYTVAIKHKEVLGPNLPLAYGLRSVDGFDGGILPLAHYASLMNLVLPEGTESIDGRLREYLNSIPDDRWLDLFGARYVLTDKVGDEWRAGVFFDMRHPLNLAVGADPVQVGYLPPYEATEIWLIGDEPPGQVEVTTITGQTWTLPLTRSQPDLWQARFPEPASLEQIALAPCRHEANTGACQDAWTIQALALVDQRDETFMPLVAGQYRTVHSGDVKIYENLDVLPDAFLVFDWISAADDAQGLVMMGSDGFDPATTAVVAGDHVGSVTNGSGVVRPVSYEPERIVIEAETNVPALLVLTEAYYPGWQATVDGRAAEIVRTDILFRGLFLAPGRHEVEFQYLPASYLTGKIISAFGLVVWLLLLCYAFLLPVVRRLPTAAAAPG